MAVQDPAEIELTDDERAALVLMIETLREAGWSVYQQTRADHPQRLEPGAGASHEGPTCTLDADFLGSLVSVLVEGLDGCEDHSLEIQYGRSEQLVDILKVIVDKQDTLTRDTYAEFGRSLLATSADIEYVGDGDGVAYEFTQAALDEGELPISA